MTGRTRRRFLATTGSGVLATALGGMAVMSRKADLHLREGVAMGAPIRILACHPNPAAAKAGLAAAFAELELIESLMSLYRPSSQICCLNEVGELEEPHPYLIQVLEEAREVSKLTNGAFDITVQPFWEVYWRASQLRQRPNVGDLDRARSKVDWRRVVFSRDHVALNGAAITLNGIAQGFATDRVKAILAEHGIRDALVDAGELGAVGLNPESEPWMVGVKDPHHLGRLYLLAALQDRCMATSGGYETRFEGPGGSHHIFDPARGKSPQALSSVSVIAKSATLADAMSTALFVLGLSKGTALVDQIPDLEVLMVDRNGEMHLSNGFPNVTV